VEFFNAHCLSIFILSFLTNIVTGTSGEQISSCILFIQNNAEHDQHTCVI